MIMQAEDWTRMKAAGCGDRHISSADYRAYGFGIRCCIYGNVYSMASINMPMGETPDGSLLAAEKQEIKKKDSRKRRAMSTHVHKQGKKEPGRSRRR